MEARGLVCYFGKRVEGSNPIRAGVLRWFSGTRIQCLVTVISDREGGVEGFSLYH